MHARTFSLLALAAVVVAVVAAAAGPFVARGEASEPQKLEAKDMKGLTERLAKYAPYALRYEDAHLSDAEKAALRKLVEAGNLVDRIFLAQLHETNWAIFEALRERWKADPTPENRALLETFWINKSPYDQLDEEAPNRLFLDGFDLPEAYDPGRTFYPKGMTPGIFDRWMQRLESDAARAAASSDFTVVRGTIRSEDDFDLETVPYSKAYAEWLGPLASKLDEAAKLVPGTTLAAFLESRARAFRTNDYEESEGIWIRMNGPDDDHGGPIDVTIGPYENYLDEVAKKKAGFEFYLGVLRPEKTRALQLFRDHVHAMDERLFTLFCKYFGSEGSVRWSPPGARVTLVAMDVVYATGMGNQGVQSLAYNLPNVEAWQEAYGTKKVILTNVLDGKFEKILAPIAKVVLSGGDQGNVVEGMFTDNTVRHEVAHGIGPSTIYRVVEPGTSEARGAVEVEDAAGRMVLARKTTVRDRLGRMHSAFEEAKAEIVSLLYGYYLSETGAIDDPEYVRRMVTTYVASGFRTIRFGVTSDHARGKVFEFNRLLDYGAIEVRDDGSYAIRYDRFRQAVEKLAMDILGLQMFGDADAAAYLLRTDGCPRRELLAALERIDAQAIPVDLRVHYPLGENWSVLESIR